MALDRLMREAVDRIDRAFREYAQIQCWSSHDYRVFVRINQEWAQIHVVLASKKYDQADINDEWKKAMTFLDIKLSDLSEHLTSLNLTLRTFAQLEGGSSYGLGPKFVDIYDILSASPIG